MNRTEFLQEKATFLITYPFQDDLSFYQYFVKQHPNLTIGWFHLGREWEKRENPDKAIEAYRQALRTKQSEYSAEAREAYHTLLRKKKKRSRSLFLRSGLTALLLLSAQLSFFPVSVGEEAHMLPQHAQVIAKAPDTKQTYHHHVEVISVPEGMPTETLKQQVNHYLKTRRPLLTEPFSLMLVPEADGIPLFTPLPFYQPRQLKAVLRVDPVKQTLLSQTWYPQNCSCEHDPLAQQTRKALGIEQRTIEQVLIVRNALYRNFQRKGPLPLHLEDLAGAYPANILPSLPQPLQKASQLPIGASNGWAYNPSAFDKNKAWESMTHVVPLPFYPEPAVPLEPLQIFIHQASFTMTLTSGPHLVRRYPIGIGKNQLSPEGYFTVLQKINRPRGQDNVYGTRGMVFSSSGHAIHGTNNPQSIGKAMSHGCIRMQNADVEELYSFVSPGTDVIISNKQMPVRTWANLPRHILPASADEETPKVVYHWLN